VIVVFSAIGSVRLAVAMILEKGRSASVTASASAGAIPLSSTRAASASTRSGSSSTTGARYPKGRVWRAIGDG
jgi:hypothetical protein